MKRKKFFENVSALITNLKMFGILRKNFCNLLQEKIIKNLMQAENVTENELREKKIIPTKFGEDLSWNYLKYVRENKIFWTTPTEILYGEKDNFTYKQTMFDFAEKIYANVTVMKDGEHWFHTAEQMNFLDNWLKNLK